MGSRARTEDPNLYPGTGAPASPRYSCAGVRTSNNVFPVSNSDEINESAVQAPLVAIVDDDALVRGSNYRLIRSFGYRAQTFDSGGEFLNSDAVAKAACILLDICMPGIDGLELQRLLAERGAEVPIVFLTAVATDEQEHRARSAGAIDFLRKPAAPERLRRALENALQNRRVRGDRDDE